MTVLPSWRRIVIRKSPYGYWAVTHGTSRKSEIFPTGATAIRAVENGIALERARRILDDTSYNLLRGSRNNRLRERLAQRDGPECHYCGKHLDPTKRTIDHVVPRVLGGPSSMDNYVLACGNCNRKKGEKVTPTHCVFCAAAYDLYWDVPITDVEETG